MEMMPELIPNVWWIPCSKKLPDQGRFVWIVVGRTIESGAAKRYVREVHMGVYQGNRGFQIFPYHLPLCSNEVWAWATMTPPDPPVCKSGTLGYDSRNSDSYKDSDSEDYDEDDDSESYGEREQDDF